MDRFWALFLMFAVYSFVGWTCESIFCSIPAKRFINRGFLNGPFCPIYGSGAMLVIFLLAPLRDKVGLLFAAGVVLTSLLEYATGCALEKLFHTKYWDYSDHRFHFQGRVCLENSLMFGVMGVIAVRFFDPAVSGLVGMIPQRALPFVSGGMILYFLLDTALSVAEAMKLNGKLAELQQVLDEIRERAHTAGIETLEALQSTIAGRLDEGTKERIRSLYERKDRLESGVRLLQRRIIRAFPTMKSLRSNESLLRVRGLLQNGAKRIRRK